MDTLKNVVSAEEAVKHIKSGDRVVLGHAAGEPTLLVNAMVKNAKAYKDVEIVHLVPLSDGEYCKEEYKDNFRHNGIFLGAATRQAVKDNRADFTPCFFHQVPSLWEEALPLDVALLSVSTPDEDGYCSLGVSVDYAQAAIKHAKTVIVQMNSKMPYTYGESKVHVDELDYIVMADNELLQLQPPKITEIEEKIGKYCAELINDGDTLQLGIGAIPDAVLLFLKDKKDLGIHSEMFSDGVVDLMEAGVVTNKKKTTHTGKCVATFLMGTNKLYDFVDKNEDIYMAPVDYVNDPRVACQVENLISINSCVEVDLMGQVNSEMVNGSQLSGIGGQLDFVRAAAMSKGGKSIIAMPSTVKGKISKIVAKFAAGTVVTTSRCDVDYIVTEYGIAKLKGKTLRERAEALINIAHPTFRDELRASLNK